MPTLNIQGQRVRVEDAFLNLSPEEQNATVEEIAGQLGIGASVTVPKPEESEASRNLRHELSAITQNPAKALYDQRPEWQKPIVAAQDIFDVGLNGLSMGFANKGAAALRSAVTGDSYEDELAGMKARTQAARDRSGGAGTAAEIGGAFALPVGLASQGVTLAGRFGSGAATGLKGITARSALGAAEGAAYGGASAYGNDTDVGTGVALGAGLGAAVPIVTSAAGAVLKPAKDAIKGWRDPKGYAAEKVAERLSNSMTPEQAANRMAANPGSNLADVGGGSTRSLLRTATNIPGSAKDKVNAQLTLRQFGQGDRLKSAISRTFADPDGYLAAKDSIAAEAQRVARPLYERAYTRPVHFSKELEGILETPAGKSALRKAEQLAANEGIPFQQMFANVADDGTAAIRRVPDTRGWDYIKRAFDDMIDGQVDSISKKMTNEGRIFTGLKNRLLAEVDKYNPDYAAARKAFAGQAQLDDALETGRNVFKLSPEALKRSVGEMSDAQKATARIGAAETLRNQIDNAGVTNNAILRVFSKPTQMKNLQTLFDSKEKFSEFRSVIFNEARKRATYDAVKGNSSTISQAADLMESGGLRDGVDFAATAATGRPVTATLNWLGSRLRMLGGFTPEVADNVAKQLMSTSPQVQTQFIQQLQQIGRDNASAAARSKEVQAMIGRLLGVGSGAFVAPPRVLGQESRQPTVIDVPVPVR